MELFVLYRGQMTDAAVEALVVPPIDPPGSSEFHIGKLPEGAFVEDLGADGFGLEQPNDGLHEAVVVGIADDPDRGLDPFLLKVRGEANAREPDARVATPSSP
nr:hypothetical protein [Nesterenkonia muleiensis]